MASVLWDPLRWAEVLHGNQAHGQNLCVGAKRRLGGCGGTGEACPLLRAQNANVAPELSGLWIRTCAFPVSGAGRPQTEGGVLAADTCFGGNSSNRATEQLGTGEWGEVWAAGALGKRELLPTLRDLFTEMQSCL